MLPPLGNLASEPCSRSQSSRTVTHSLWRKGPDTLTAGLWDTGYPPKTVSFLLLQIKTTQHSRKNRKLVSRNIRTTAPLFPASGRRQGQPVEGPLPGSKQPALGLCWAGHRQSWVRKVACFSKAATQFPSSAPGYRKQEATRPLCRCLFVASVPHLEGGSQFPKHKCREQNVQEMCLPRTSQWQDPESGLSAFRVPGLMWFSLWNAVKFLEFAQKEYLNFLLG